MVQQTLFARVQYGVWIPISDIAVHPTIQRKFREDWARHLLSRFDPDALRPLQVVRDEKGKYLVFDGQHRLWAAREYLGNSQKIPCDVHQNLPVARLAKLFIEVNDAKGLRAIDNFLMSVKANEEAATRITEIVESFGLKISDEGKDGHVRAVSAMKSLFDRYGEHCFERTLNILKSAWGKDKDAYASQFIGGVGYLVHRFNGKLDDGELARKMARTHGPSKMIGEARDRAKISHISVSRSMAEILTNIYDRGRRTKTLILEK